MRVENAAGAASIWFKTLEKNPATELQSLVDAAATGKNEPAKSSGPNAFFPVSLKGGLAVGSVMILQGSEGLDESKAPKANAEDEFLAYMKKTPEERLRDSILKSMGMTEEDLEGMPPEQRQAIEKKIAEIIKEKLTSGQDAEDSQQARDERIRARLLGLPGQTLSLNV